MSDPTDIIGRLHRYDEYVGCVGCSEHGCIDERGDTAYDPTDPAIEWLGQPEWGQPCVCPCHTTTLDDAIVEIERLRADNQALADLILSENVIVHERHVEHADRLLAPYLGNTE